MIRSPLGLRLDAAGPLREQAREAAAAGARGVVIEAIGEFGPDRLGETARREVRNLLRSIDIGLIALALPTRRPFDSIEQLDDRLARADRAFALAYELGTRLVLVQAGAVPPESEADRHRTFRHALAELARRADHHGVRLALETGADPGQALRAELDAIGSPALAASLDPNALLARGLDPVATALALGNQLVHAYAGAASARPTRVMNPRGVGFAPGVLDWENYLGALEEIGYAGFLTVWPEAGATAAAQFKAIAEITNRF